MITKKESQGISIIELENEQLSVSLCPALGNNLFKIWDKKRQRNVLRSPTDLQDLLNEPGQYGTPLMMPPNRIRNGSFLFGDQHYQFQINSIAGHHMHGFLRSRPWSTVSTQESPNSDSVSCVFRVSDFPEVFEQFPHPLTIEVTYELTGTRLTQRTTATNLGSTPAPFGYGLHTWFMIDGEPEKWKLTIPCESIWKLDADLIPIGERMPLGQYESIQTGLPLQGINLDTTFQIGNNPRIATLSTLDYTIKYAASDLFKQWVVFTAGEANQFICLEPYTWVTNAPNLDLSPDLTGFRAIPPSATFSMDVTLEILHH